jgi:ABC-type dipeptide/oligopeptide/nickel transport system permease subunit
MAHADKSAEAGTHAAINRSQTVVLVDGRRSWPVVSGLANFARGSPTGAIAAYAIVLVILVAVFADALSPFNPYAGSLLDAAKPPTAAHKLGTDQLGRDLLSRLIYGTRITLVVGISSVLLGNTLGFLWGVTTGYVGGRFDIVSQRIIEVLLSFPTLILALLLLVALNAGITTVITAIAVTQIPFSTRVIRSVVLSVKTFAYVESARCVGSPAWRIMLREIAPPCVAPFMVVLSLNLGGAIFAEAALSFLGVGVPPPAPSWGNMLGGVLAQAFRPPWWMVLFPGIAITLTIMAANLLGDGLRDFMDPRLRRRVE